MGLLVDVPPLSLLSRLATSSILVSLSLERSSSMDCWGRRPALAARAARRAWRSDIMVAVGITSSGSTGSSGSGIVVDSDK